MQEKISQKKLVMSAHQRILAGSFGFSQPQLLNVSFRSTERQTPKLSGIM
jgi:hypothetical protein